MTLAASSEESSQTIRGVKAFNGARKLGTFPGFRAAMAISAARMSAEDAQ
jgi:hypothetical protein